MVHQQQTEVRTDEGTAAKSHDGHAGRHARAIGKPFHQSRNRRDVTQTEAATTYHSVTKINDPKLIPPDAQSGNGHVPARAKSGRRQSLARSNPFHPTAENRS